MVVSSHADQSNRYAVVMAGGSGTRLWPLSRQRRPKQFLALQQRHEEGKRPATLLQQAVLRALQLVGAPERVLVVTQERYRSLAQEQLAELQDMEGANGAQFPSENLVLEPVGRNTAPCLGLAARLIQERERNLTAAPEPTRQPAVMIALPADHLYRETEPWLRALHSAIQFASAQPFLVTLGIPPHTPSSRYGYLLLGDRLDSPAAGPTSAGGVYRVQAYIEKPSLQKAQELIASGNALWNTGTFVWQVDVFLTALQRYQPEIAAALQDLSPAHLQEVYPQLPQISVDYGVMEKAWQDAGSSIAGGNIAGSSIAVVKSDFERLDLGALDSLTELWSPDARGNILNGTAICLDSNQDLARDNLIFSDQGLVAALGVHDLAIVRHEDVVLICPRQRLNEVAELIKQLRVQGWENFL